MKPPPKGEWICTDPDCNQHMKIIDDLNYIFYEDRLSDPLNNKTYTYSTTINLRDYTREEIYNSCEAFGYSREDISEWLILNSNLSLIAECLFKCVINRARKA